jgi:hypothetical protein
VGAEVTFLTADQARGNPNALQATTILATLPN